MKKNLIFTASAFLAGAVIGYFVGKKCIKKKDEVEEPVKLYPDEDNDDDDDLNDFDHEDSEDDITTKDVYKVAKNNGYITEISQEEAEDIEAIESSQRYMRYMEKHAGEIFIISPDPENRSDELNEIVEFLDRELLLYFPNEDDPDKDILCTEGGDELYAFEETGNCLYKYHFAEDGDQDELHILNVPKQMYYIIKKETDNTYEELFPED